MKNLAKNCALAAAVVVVPSATFAQSNVTIYGIVDVTTRHATNATPAWKNAVGDGAFTGTRLGFRGQEDLGDGAKAFFSLETGFDPSTGVFQQATATADYG